jgi:acetate kinase
MDSSNAILALNRGSSSLKFALYQAAAGSETLLAQGAAEGIGLPNGRLWVKGASEKETHSESCNLAHHGEAIGIVLRQLDRRSHPTPAAVGHRLVNGGPDNTESRKITPKLLDELRGLIPLAPLHLPTEIKVIEAIASELPDVPQVACFDTEFHRTMPEVARRFPLPRNLWAGGLERYGFHGLSYEYIIETLGSRAKGRRLIIAHLGNGASLAAVRDARSLETTMGFTPTGGVMMGTRTGDLDPGVLLYLLRERHYDAEKLERLVDHESGLRGVSGLTSDMKTLLESRATDPRAREAVEMFCYSIRKQIGALAAVLGGIDLLVFTGGIGERAAPVRAEICQGLEYIGVQLDAAKNDAHSERISPPSSPCAVLVMETNEELMIARHTRRLLFP